MSQITGIPSVNNLTLAGSTAYGALLCLTANATIAGNTFSTLRRAGITSGYQVTAGKTLFFVAARVVCLGGSATGTIALLYGDTDVGMNASASAPTTPVYLNANTTNGYIALLTAVGVYDIPLPGMNVPATKFPCVYTPGTPVLMSCMFWAYEA